MFTFRAEVGEPVMKVFQGRDHVVVPIIALVEGVLQACNSPQPELIQASEIKKSVQSWNGRPVVVDHPEIRGEKVSANDPDVLEAEQVGLIFNAKASGSKLRLDAWIDVETAEGKEGRINETIAKIVDGDIIEISTGFFADTTKTSGMFGDKEFKGVITNINPDHLAILSSAKGACSIEDGCGANRANAKGGDKVKLKPNCEGVADCACNKNKAPKTAEELKDFSEVLRVLFTKSHENIRASVQAALDLEDSDSCDFVFLVDITDEFVIFATWDGVFRRPFELSEDGSVTLGDEISKVRPETEFVPVKTNEVKDMSNNKLVDGLITNEASTFTEDDRKWLSGLEDDQLEKLEPVEPDPAPEEEAPVEEAAEEEPDPVEEPADETPVTAEAYIAGAPEAVQEVLNQGLRLQKERREELVKVIKANTSNKFTDDDLAAFQTDALENLASLAATADYSGRGAPRAASAEDANIIPPAPEAFPVKAVS